jgi:hypothetical protein
MIARFRTIRPVGVKRRLIAAALGVGAILSASAAAAPSSDEVTMKVQRLPDGRGRFSGTISSGAANEYVVITEERCGSNIATSFGGASTERGGSWETEPFNPLGSATYRAKWGTHVSAPVTFRMPVRLTLSHFQRGRHRVVVFANANLNRRPVELQRLASGRWVRVRRARLEPSGGAFIFNVWFTVRTKGLRLRVVVPAASAAPCHDPAASETFKS